MSKRRPGLITRDAGGPGGSRWRRSWARREINGQGGVFVRVDRSWEGRMLRLLELLGFFGPGTLLCCPSEWTLNAYVTCINDSDRILLITQPKQSKSVPGNSGRSRHSCINPRSQSRLPRNLSRRRGNDPPFNTLYQFINVFSRPL